MSEKRKGLAKFLAVILFFVSCWYFYLGFIINILFWADLLVLVLLYFKKYKSIWIVLVLSGVLCVVNTIHGCGCGDVDKVISAFVAPFIYVSPIVVVYWGIGAVRRYLKNEKTDRETFIFLCIWGVIFCFLLFWAIVGWYSGNVVVEDQVIINDTFATIEGYAGE